MLQFPHTLRNVVLDLGVSKHSKIQFTVSCLKTRLKSVMGLVLGPDIDSALISSKSLYKYKSLEH